MTESTFPFEAAGEEPEAKGDRRKLAVVAGAGALAVAVLGYFVVVPMLSGAEDTTEALIVRKRPAATAPKTAAKPAVKKPVAQPATYADTSARTDPFKPLIVEPVVAPAGPVVAPPVTGGTTDGTTSGGTTGGTTAPSGTTSGTATNVGGQRVALVHVYAKDGSSYAQTKVGDTVHTPKVGDVFAGTYKLLAVSGKTATYLYGDEQFTLSEGQEVLK